MLPVWPFAVLPLVCMFALAACERTATDLREWRPTDHDHTQTPSAAQVDVSDAAARPSTLHGIDEVVLVAWRQNCTTCHGIIGRGDGPQAPMTRPPNLSDSAFQARVSDAQIAETIRTGRGSMPAFDLPETTVTGLVKLVRLFDAARPATAGDAAPLNPQAPDAAAHDAGPPVRASDGKPAGKP